MFVRVVPLALLGWLCVTAAPAHAQQVTLPAMENSERFMATALSGDLPQAAALVETLAAAGDLQLVSSRPDPYLAGYVHDGFRQFHQGVPVLGGGLTRQAGASGPLSVFGTLHEDIDVDVTPSLSANEAVSRARRAFGAEPATSDLPELVLLPTLTGRYVLAWSVVMDDFHRYFLDAHSGAVVERLPLFKRQQAAVGAGPGIQGVEKKVSVSRDGGAYQAYDRLRPAEIVTLDMRLDEERTLGILGPDVLWTAGDVAASAGDTWSDSAVVDAHAYTGFAYDHILRRHGWRGADGRDGRMFNMVNLGGEDFGYDNAFFFFPPFGPEGTGVFGYGTWEGGLPLTSVDIVGHEVLHSVVYHALTERTGTPFLPSFYGRPGPTSFQLEDETVTCEDQLRRTLPDGTVRTFRLLCEDGRLLLVSNHLGAIEEALCDILGTALEFDLHADGPAPLAADYLNGEDSGRVIRSLSDPASLRVVRDPSPELEARLDELGIANPRLPDAFQHVIEFLVGIYDDTERGFIMPYGSVDGKNIVRLPATDRGGVHLNSTVLSHAFYLAVEGGRNRSTGLEVTGTGAGDLAQVERAFVRALLHLMPQGISMFDAADIIRVSAFQMYGIDSAVFQAIHQALTAVGLPLQIPEE